jgi:hypothetical protein
VKSRMALIILIGGSLALAGFLLAAQTGPVPVKTIKDCADCPQMVVVPAGQFMMGGDVRAAARVGSGSDEQSWADGFRVARAVE